MAIEWAPISVDGSRDPAVRRHARSLAMRQFRKRQKQELCRRDNTTIEDTATGCTTIPKRTLQRKSDPHAMNATVKRKHAESRATSSVFNALSWRDNGEERIQDPKNMAESLLLCKRYLQWLRPDEKLTDADFAIFVAQQSLPDPLLIAASHLVAGRYLDAAHFRPPNKNNTERKNEILTSLNARLNDTDSPMSGDVVNAIVCLLHFELCDGNSEALVHLQGIKALMGAADSSDSHLFASCSMSLEMGDLVHALMFSNKTEFVSLGKQNPLNKPTYSSYHVDFLKQELDQINNLIIYPYFTEVDVMIQDVSRTIEQSFDKCEDNQGVNDEAGLQTLARTIDSLRHQRQSSDLELFVQAGKATSMIIYRYAVQKSPFNDLANQNDLDSIINAILHIPSERWRILKYFRLFMLLAAVCAAQEPGRKSFCEAHLVRAILHIGPDAWINTRKFIVKFIDNVNAVQRPPGGQGTLHGWVDACNSDIRQRIDGLKRVPKTSTTAMNV